jgi:hypothetical protein
MNPNKKYYSKYYLGLCKQYTRYINKPEVMRKPIFPQIISYNEVTEDYEPLTQNFCKKWINGTTLKELLNKANNHSPSVGGMYSKFSKNKEGKYSLSLEGKRILKRKKLKIIK